MKNHCRLQALLIALLIALTPSISHALGLGEIDMKRNPNNPFMAEIPVFLDYDGARLQASIGTEADYKMMGRKRPSFVNSLQVVVVQDNSAASRKIIRVTSSEKISYPSFYLIIKATSDGGTVIESYFLAIDYRKTLSLELPPEQKAKPTAKPAAIKKVRVVTPKPVAVTESLPIAVTRLEAKQSRAIGSHIKKIKERKIEEVKPIKQKKTAKKPPASMIISTAPIGKPKPQKQKQAEEIAYAPVRSVMVGRGDTLYGIVKNLGVKKSEVRKVARLVFKANRNAFIKGNINMMLAGRQLSLLGISGIPQHQQQRQDSKPTSAKLLETATAGDRIKEGSGGKFEIPTVQYIATEKVRNFVINWATHWETQDFNAMKQDYSNRFMNGKGSDKDKFLKIRFNFTRSKINIEIDIKNLSIIRSGNHFDIYFTQWFRSSSFASVGRKEMSVINTGYALKIIDEKFSYNVPAKKIHPWVVSVASSNNKKYAKDLIKALRSGGWEAFEATGFINDSGFTVMVGRTALKKQAEKQAMELDVILDGIMKTKDMPYALEISRSSTAWSAQAAFDKASSAGLSPYIIEKKFKDKTWVTVYIGAFPTKESAEAAGRKLIRKSDGLTFKVSIP